MGASMRMPERAVRHSQLTDRLDGVEADLRNAAESMLDRTSKLGTRHTSSLALESAANTRRQGSLLPSLLDSLLLSLLSRSHWRPERSVAVSSLSVHIATRWICE
jgi:hypothetical protein